jgi:RHS repeat-associated protein
VAGTAEPGSTFYYGPYSGSFSVQAQAADRLAGLDAITFPDTTSSGHTYAGLAGASSATRTWAYDFIAASSFEGTIPVTATDRATNEGPASFTLVRDGAPPAVAVTATVQAEDIRVTWAASDTGSDLNTCSLEVDTGDGSPEELSTSCEGSRIYTEAEPGQTCIFHLTAADNVGNQASAEATSGLPRVTKYYHHGGKRVAMRSGGQVYYLHGDHLDSTSLTTDAEGEIVARQLYHPYGSVRYSEGTLPTDFGFTGQRQDGTGLVFMHARYYHAGLARFTQADTIVPQPGNPQDLNRFAYTRNNPLAYVDPSGHTGIPPGQRPPSEAECWNNPSIPGCGAYGFDFRVPAGRYYYSEDYGWFDKDHIGTGDPVGIIRDVRRRISEGGGMVTVKGGVGRKIGPVAIQGTYIRNYQIPGEATMDDAIGIALGIYMDWSIAFEAWEGSTMVLGVPVGMNTAFAIEDLPSHYAGFWAAATELSTGVFFARLGGVEGTDEEPPRATDRLTGNIPEIKNYEFTPKVQDETGHWHNVPWPNSLTITPIGSESGLWTFQSAECKGNVCSMTSW